MNFPDAVKAFYNNYSDFSGRSTRPAYWWVQLYLLMVYIPLWIISAVSPTLGLVLIVLFWVAHIIPGLALFVRRLHDSGKSGWYILLGFVPFVGGLILLVLTLLPTEPFGNDWGMPEGGPQVT